jgi:hypothetical protein
MARVSKASAAQGTQYGPFKLVIDEILEADLDAPRKP